MKITALTENTSQCGFPTEHGLSLYLETGTHQILFDAGQSSLFAENARCLGIDLREVDLAVLSHGHYDHGGGMTTFLSLNHQAPLYLSSEAFGQYYNGTEKYIGLSEELRRSDRLIFVSEPTMISPQMTLYPSQGRQKRIEFGSFGLNMLRDGQMQPDDFRHEQYLLIEEAGKRILISGCSHQGILNIVEWFRPDVLIGGFHFSKLPTDKTLRSFAKELDAYDTEYYTCHCTGTAQYEWMKQSMQHLHYLSTGQSIEL